MSPTRFPRVRRTVPGVGRVQLATGATTKREHDRRVALFDDLVEAGEVATVRALVAGSLSFAELRDAQRHRTGTLLATVAGRATLASVIAAHRDTIGPTQTTRRRYLISLDRLATLVGDVRVSELATLDWRSIEGQWGKSAADWMHARRALSRLLSLHLGGPSHPMRRAVLAAVPTRREVSRVPDVSPESFARVLSHVRPDLRPAYVAIVLLGVRRGEYLRLQPEHLMPETCRVRVPGSKSAAAVRVVAVDPAMWPWVAAAVPAPLAYKWLRIHWTRACAAAGVSDRRLHDLRHAMAQWASAGGASLGDLMGVLGHATEGQSAQYARQESGRQVAGHVGRALRRVLGA
jgi:integrase